MTFPVSQVAYTLLIVIWQSALYSVTECPVNVPSKDPEKKILIKAFKKPAISVFTKSTGFLLASYSVKKN